MISRDEIAEAGKFNKPHGIKGEISVAVDDPEIDLEEVKCLIVEMDGIYVPFFINTVRPKSAETWLVTIDGVESEEAVRQFVNRPFFLLKSDLPEGSAADGDEADGFYAEDLIGYTVDDENLGHLGEITDVNDTTDNVLFVITAADGAEILLPVADEFILDIDTENKILTTDVPEGIVDLN